MRRPHPLARAATIAGTLVRVFLQTRGSLLELAGASCIVAGVDRIAGPGPALVTAGVGLLAAGLVRS